MCRCGTLGHGLMVDLAVFGLHLQSMILRAFSNLSDSMILIHLNMSVCCTWLLLSHLVALSKSNLCEESVSVSSL